jgi:uncharacterized membrane protein YbhN (UPF0104 family)
MLGSGALLGVLAVRLDWQRLGAAFARLDVGLWLLALGVYGLAQAVSGLRWQRLAALAGFGGRPRRYVAYYFIGMFFNLALPTSVGGDVVRAWYLARQAEGPVTGRRGAALLSVLLERGSGLCLLVVVACVATALCPLPLPSWVVAVVVALGSAAALGLALLPLLPRLLPLLPARLRGLAEGGLAYLRHPWELLLSAALSALVQAAGLVLVGLIGRSLGLPVPPLYYGVLVPLVTLLTLLPVSVNGVGLREVACVALLAPLGVGRGEAVALGLLWFAVGVAAGLGGAVVYLVGDFPRLDRSAAAKAEVRGDGEPVGDHPGQGRARQPPAAA